MKRVNRRNFVLLASVGGTGAVLSACGNDLNVDVNPTMIPDIAGAPPTLVPTGSPVAGASPTAESGGQAAGGAGEPVTLEAQDPYNWSTNTLEAAPGQVIRVTNTGLGQHNFTVDEWSVAEDLPNGEPVDVTVPDDAKPGDTFTYYCSVPGHRENGMEGTLTIVEAKAAVPAQQQQPAEGGAPASGAGEPVTLEAQDPYNWSANALEAAPGQVIRVTNTGLGQHDFSVDEWGVAEDLPNGEPVDVTVPEDAKPGDTFTYYCSVPGHRENGMEGTLTITEAKAAAPAQAPASQAAATPPAQPPAASTPAAQTAPVTASPTPPATPAARATPRPGTIALQAQDPFVWKPNTLTVAPGDVISVTNTGVLEHNFAVDEWSIDRLIPNGDLIEVQVPNDVTSGETFAFYCSTPGHREQGMEGTITIK